MKVKILSIDSSVLKSSAGGVRVCFLYDGMEYSVNVYPGQSLKEVIHKTIDEYWDIELKQLEAEFRVEELKGLEGTELDIGEG